MPDDLSPTPKRKPLVSVEFQREVDIATGIGETRMFVKMYFDARDSGLLAALGDREWRTLCVLATYMDENGVCFPSQSRIAKDLGITRQHANKRIQDLLAFRFQGQPVITLSRMRLSRPGGSRWSNNLYQLRPISGFAIFDDQKPAPSSVSPKGDIQPSVSGNGDTQEGDTNQTQSFNKKVLNPLPSNDHKEGRSRTPTISDRALRSKYGLETAQLAQVHYLVGKQGEVLGSIGRDHGHFVKRAAEAVVAGHADLLDETLSRFKEIARKRSPASSPAYFQTVWTEAVENHRIHTQRGRKSEGETSARRGGFEALGSILREPKGPRELDPDDEATFA